jgi:hypothetical protein
MLQKNKILASLIISLSIFSLSYADNKSDVLTNLSTLETNLKSLRDNYTKDLENRAISLSSSYNSSITELGYDVKVVDYLFKLGKISSNFKNDLTSEVNTLTKEISDKSSTELTSLNSIKNDINLNYSTVSDTEKVTLSNNIKSIESNYTNLSNTLS